MEVYNYLRILLDTVCLYGPLQELDTLSFIYNCWFVRGRIKEKIGTIYAIKNQVYCMENTAQWSANTVQLF